MITPAPSTLARRGLKPLWGWAALVALTQMGMASRGCFGSDEQPGTGTAGGTGGSLGNAGSGGGSSGSGCDYGGQRRAIGDSFKSTDGCNTCSCTGSGVACTERACLQTCGGITGAGCPANQYCDFPQSARCGAADQTGTCAPKPDACDDIYQPVCGCDDRSYGNACEAASRGISVASPGECGGGGTAGTGSGGGSSCNGGYGCVQPPCACLDSDGDNQCDNQCPIYECRNGQCVDVSVKPVTCGGLLGTGCPDGQYCKFLPDARCGAADATGECQVKSEFCTEEYNPVCGCDGKTYGNGCAAASAGVSVQARGECDGAGTLGLGDSCGGFRAQPAPACGDGLFCQHQPGALCGAADAPGECVTIPTSCPTTGTPVCGCNGITYANACSAARAQVGILDTGRCN